MRDIFGDGHLTVLRIAQVQRDQCTECTQSAPLFVYSTVRKGGYGKVRQHAGAFCCKQCHDIHHNLKPRN